MCVEHIKSPLDNAKTKIDHIYTGPNTSKVYDDMVNCDQEGVLMASICLTVVNILITRLKSGSQLKNVSY